MRWRVLAVCAALGALIAGGPAVLAQRGVSGTAAGEGGEVQATGCVFSGNSAHGVSRASAGGAVGCYRECLGSLNGCTFEGSSADLGGGLSAEHDGWTNGATLSATNCIFRGNTARRGGAVYAGMDNAAADVVNCSLVDNTASETGAATRAEINAEAFLRNCIVWGDGPGISNDDGSYTFVQYSCVRGGYPGTGNIDEDPWFVDAPNGDFRLEADSPCIDAGTAVDAPETDIRGVARPQGGGIDMGAYEMAPEDYED